MNLPEEHWYARVDQLSDASRPVVERYVLSLDRRLARADGLYVYGPTGVGKTTLVSVLAKEARAHGYTVLFVRVWELRELIRSRVDFDDETTMVGRARDVDFLVLDDLREDDSREKFFTLSEITALVKDRRERRRVTLVTSSVGPRELAEKPWRVFREVTEGVLVRFGLEGPNYLALRRPEQEQAVLGK
jgi:DNA replication protein DnaC